MSDRDASAVKTCPQCGQMLFADMRVCYGCLHDFEREGEPAVGQAFVGVSGQGAARRVDVNDRQLVDGVTTPTTDGSASAHGMRGDAMEVEPTEHAGNDIPVEEAPVKMPAASPGQSRAANAASQASNPPSERAGTRASQPLRRGSAESVALRIQTTALDVVLPVPTSGLCVGRAPDNDIVLHSPLVSERHLRLEPSGEGISVLDLGATNPARLRGHRVLDELPLATGDVLEVCGTVMTLIRT